MKTKIRENLYLFLIWMILGILLTTSFYAQQKVKASSTDSRKKVLIATIKDLEKERNGLKSELENLRKKISEYETKAAADEGVLSTFTQKLSSLELAAGLVPVKGQGIVVTLEDSISVPPNKNPNDYIIHDTDIRSVVNALWSGGAEAISVNNQRIVSNTAIRCAGNTILINSTRLGTPYEIKAIGKNEQLLESLNKDQETKRLLGPYAKNYNLLVKVEKIDSTTIPAYKGSMIIEYARPSKGE